MIANKKTFLYLTALQKSDKLQAEELEHLFSINPKDSSDKIKTVKSIFKNSGAAQATIEEISKYTKKANNVLNKIDLSEDKKGALRSFGDWLMNRTV